MKKISISLTEVSAKAERSERQERAIILGVNQYASIDNPITVKAGNHSVSNVVEAKKMEGCNKFGCEQYTDVVLITSDGAEINVSCKGTTSPSIAGGGLLGLKALFPYVVPKFLEAAERWYLQNKYKEGDLIPDIYGKMNDDDKMLAIVGTEEIGGPIDYMYVGPMDIEGRYSDGLLEYPGDLMPAAEYADTHEVFFRLRKRRNDQPFMPGQKDKSGYPLILGRSPSKGDTGRRIVLVNKLPKTRNIVEF